MANIIENFNDTQLELITSGSKISYQFNEESGDYIRLTVFSDDTLRYYNHFSSNDGENGFDIYKDHNENIYVKVNEVLENGYVAEGNYTLQFDFLRDSFFNFHEIIDGGCSNPTDDASEEELESIAGQDGCTSQGQCIPFEGDIVEFQDEIDCCGETGDECEGEEPNVWLAYVWTPASYSFIEGYEGSNFYIKEISPSRKEVRLIGRNQIDDILNFDDDVFRAHFSDKYYGIAGGLGTLNDGDGLGDFEFDYVLTLNESLNIPIVNWTYDERSLNETTLVLRLNKPLPSDATLLDLVGIQKEVLPTHQQFIRYISNIKTMNIGANLTPDLDVYYQQNEGQEDNYQNYNQLVATSSINEIDIDYIELQKNNDYQNLKIDFSEFENHVLFGSAKSKVENFKDKVVKIENHLSEISSSLNQSGSHIVTQRRNLFSKIKTVKGTFTPYEKFLYYGKSSGSHSAPNIGTNYAHMIPMNMLTTTTLNNYEGFNVVQNLQESEQHTYQGFNPFFSSKYNVEDPPFNNYSSSVYLSFVMRADETLGTESDHSSTNTFKWSQTAGTMNHEPSSPYESQHTRRILEPTPTGSEWRRNVFETSHS